MIKSLGESSTHEQKSGDFVAFQNEYKYEQRHPDFRGYGIDLNGKKCDIAVWLKQTRDGKQLLSMKISEPRPRQGQEKQQAQAQSVQVIGGPEYSQDQEDDLPF